MVWRGEGGTVVASGWQVDTGRQVDTALGLSESSSTLCSAGHSSSATCDAAFQLGGQVGSARLVRRLPKASLIPLLCLPACWQRLHDHFHLLTLYRVKLATQFSNVKSSQKSRLHLKNIANFLQAAPSIFQHGGGVPISLIPKNTLFSP